MIQGLPARLAIHMLEEPADEPSLCWTSRALKIPSRAVCAPVALRRKALQRNVRDVLFVYVGPGAVSRLEVEDHGRVG